MREAKETEQKEIGRIKLSNTRELVASLFRLRRKEVRRVYKCSNCGKWFKEAKMGDHGPLGKVEICPFCERRVYQIRGIKAALVSLWWWLKEGVFLGKKGG